MSISVRSSLVLSVVLLPGFLLTPADLPAQSTATDVARQVDQLIAEEIGGESAAQISSDEVFLRRAFLDLVGEPPTSNDLLAFSLDTRADKRAKLVKQLLADDGYGTNWGRYWRDVIMFRRTEDRAILSQPALEEFLVTEFNANTPWNSIARQLITATGNVRENGQTGLIMAQGGRPEDTVAEISRIFMGIQIQCAQCHDHPTDRWTREQFHQLVAFFPRVAVRPTMMGNARSFAVIEKPELKGTLMQPVFFATGQQLQTGVLDKDRRETLSSWITSPENSWCAKALVNRLWSELVGEGFYEPVDDIGPDRDCSAPRTLDLLCNELTAHDYDIKWLMETILLTRTYQLESRNRRSLDELPFQANCPQRLRSDQLFNSLLAVFDIEDVVSDRPAAYGPAMRQGRGAPRLLFNSMFGFDPSTRRDEIGGSIPQALAMMNSPFINQQINAQHGQMLAPLLAEVNDDRQLVEELYIRVLSRQELRVCLDFRRGINSRSEAFEDILWALLNHAEFIHRK